MRSARHGSTWALVIGAGLIVAFTLAVVAGDKSRRTRTVTRVDDHAVTRESIAASDDDSLATAARAIPGAAGEEETTECFAGATIDDDGASLPRYEARMTESASSRPEATHGQPPSDPSNEYAMAIAALKNGDPERAAGGLQTLLEAFGDDTALRAKVRVHLARAHLAMQESAKAGEEGDGALRTPDATAEQRGANAGRAASHLRRALAFTEDAVALDERSDAAWNVRGLAFLAANRGAEAAAAFEKAVELNPSNPNAQNNLGYVRILRGEAAAAVAPLRAARDAAERQGIDLPAHVFNNLGVALESTGSFEEASEAFRQAAAGGHAHASVSLARVEERLAITDRHASAESLAVLSEIRAAR